MLVSEPSSRKNSPQRRENCDDTKSPTTGRVRRICPGQGSVAVLDREVVFGDELLLVETEKARRRADEPAIKNTARQLLPLLFLKSFEEACADAGRDRNFLQGYAAQFAFAPQMFAEGCPLHS